MLACRQPLFFSGLYFLVLNSTPALWSGPFFLPLAVTMGETLACVYGSITAVSYVGSLNCKF